MEGDKVPASPAPGGGPGGAQERLRALISACSGRLRGLKGAFLLLSCSAAAGVVLTFVFALAGSVLWSAVFCVLTAALLLLTNLWFRERVTSPILGLGDTARHIADGSYGALAERLRDDEIGELTDAINDMSVKIGRADRVQNEFISSISHELRTPLTAITGWSETLIADAPQEGDFRRGLEIISRESGRLTAMVEDLLEFTRMRDGRFTLSLEQVDVAELMEEVCFTYSKLLVKDGLALRWKPPRDRLPFVTADPRRLKQVVLNILDNAAKYGRSGRSIEVACVQEGEYVRISVRDHGPGIAAEDLPHVKERFYKGRGKERGSGIGLAVCDEIVARHSGRLKVENAPGGGALVTVLLPVETQ